MSDAPPAAAPAPPAAAAAAAAAEPAAAEPAPAAEDAAQQKKAMLNSIFGDSDSDDDGAGAGAGAGAKPAAKKAAKAADSSSSGSDSDSSSSGSGSSSSGSDSDSSDSSDSDAAAKSKGKKPKGRLNRLRKGGGSGGAKAAKPAARKRKPPAAAAAQAKRRRRLTGGGGLDSLQLEAPPAPKPKAAGDQSGDEYDSEPDVQATADDEAFIDREDDDDGILDEYARDKQKFKDVRPEDMEDNGRKEPAYMNAPDQSPLDLALAAMKGARHRSKPMEAQDMEEAVVAFLQAMDNAAMLDKEASQQGRPATHKLAFLPRLRRTLSKRHWHVDLLERDLLSVMRRWLEPGPGGALPSLTVRTEILQLLQDMPVEKDHLKRSGLGKTMMGLWKSQTETPANKQLLKNLIERWSRPIFQKSTDFRRLAAAQQPPVAAPAAAAAAAAAAPAGGAEGAAGAAAAAPTVDLGGGGVVDEAPRERFIRVPQPVSFAGARRAKKRLLVTQNNKRDPDSTREKLNKRMQNLRRPPQKNKRAVSMSIEGR